MIYFVHVYRDRGSKGLWEMITNLRAIARTMYLDWENARKMSLMDPPRRDRRLGYGVFPASRGELPGTGDAGRKLNTHPTGPTVKTLRRDNGTLVTRDVDNL